MVLLIVQLSFAASPAAVSIGIINQDPDPASGGSIVEVRLGIENRGGTSSGNLIVEVIPAYPFKLASGQSGVTEVGIIRADSYEEDVKIIKYKLLIDREVNDGDYELDIQYKYEGTNAYTQVSVPLTIANTQNVEVIHIDKAVLIPGAQSSLKFTINNVGRAPLNDLKFLWESEDQVILPVGSDNSRFISYIEVGGSAEVEYQVIADTNADPGLYRLSLFLEHDSLNEGYEVETIAGVYVGGDTDFDISLSESSMTETSFTIANIGSNPAYSVLVSLPTQKGWKISPPTSTIIGNLNTGDYTVATFTLSQGSATELALEIAYTNTMGQRQVVEKIVEFQSFSRNATTEIKESRMGSRGMPSSQPSFFEQYNWQIVVIVLVILALVFRGWIKKKKQINPNFKLGGMFKK